MNPAGLTDEFAALLAPLAQIELPDFNPADPPFGFVFSAPQVLRSVDEPVVSFATVVDGEEEYMGVRVRDGQVVLLRPGSRRAGYVNASISDFVYFLSHIQEYKTLADQLDPDPPSWTLTVAETDAILKRFEEGSLKTRDDPPQRRQQLATLKRNLRSLRAQLRERDANAIRASNWWGMVLTEYGDALP
jgi:hypothetical protein